MFKQSVLLIFLLAGVAFSALAQQTYAVVVGVADYQNLSNNQGDLRYADDDAQLVTRFLKSPQGGSVSSDHIVTLTNSQATHANILEALRIFERARPSDRVIFHFSGHGDGGVFYPYDAPKEQLLHQELKAAFRRSAAKTKIVWADACLSGSLKRRNPQPQSSQSYTHFNDPKLNIVVMTSSRYNQNSAETSRLRQGVFTYFLIKGAQGEADVDQDRIVTVQEHYEYVRKQVAALTRNRQIPTIYGHFSNTMPIIKL
ncbi:caspase family protein [Spirosoma aerolatum]|uniref:caspase family protein n=1 Tax=Spirosoma aerolatum TaxID=1211326 RepID=UPI0009AD392B|nr:caspase family protein [Spirosoma aerolatum]